MKLFVSLLLGAVVVGFADRSASAQPSYGAQAYAQRQQEEQRWKKLSAQMEELLASQEVLRKRIQSLEEDNRRLSKKITDSSASGVNPADLNKVVKQLEDQIRKVDEARIADHKKLTQSVNDSIDKLQSLLKNQPTRSAASSSSSGSGTFFSHTIRSGENISRIAEAFRLQGYDVTVDSILKANPGVDPNTLQVGQVIKIPKP